MDTEESEATTRQIDRFSIVTLIFFVIVHPNSNPSNPFSQALLSPEDSGLTVGEVNHLRHQDCADKVAIDSPSTGPHGSRSR